MTNSIPFVLLCMTAAAVISILLSEYTTNNMPLTKSITEQDPQLPQQIHRKKLTEQNYFYKRISRLTRIEDANSSTLTSSLPSFSTSMSPLPHIFKEVEGSVVQITAKLSNDGQDIIINSNPSQSQSTILGSGFVYDKERHIVTNSHVVDKSKTVDITFLDGNTYTASVIGNDPSSDISVLEIADGSSLLSSGQNSTANPLVMGNSSKLEVGQEIIAIGNPFGVGDIMTTGIISRVGRLLPNPHTGFSIPDGIQTDAVINPGNSGGPLLNMQGQVIGMNTVISSSSGIFSGLGFAIPSNIISRIVPILIQKGSYAHPWLGISGGSITPDLAQSVNLPKNFKGVIVGSVQSGSPADKAGIRGASQDIMNLNPQIGDIITAIDNHPVRRIDDIINYIESHKAIGDVLDVNVNRNGKAINLKLILQPRPTSSS